MLNLRDVIEQPGASVPFSYVFDLSDMSFPFGKPFVEPITADGAVKNTAGLLTLDAMLRTVMCLTCDRCNAVYRCDLALPVQVTLAEKTEYDDDEIVLITGDSVDLAEIFTTALVLSTDMKHLCREDCMGLCTRCGHNLNEGLCDCALQDVDPRLSALKEYLNRLEND